MTYEEYFNQFLNIIKDECVGIYEIGSWKLPYIQSPHDKDVIFFVNTRKEHDIAKQKLKEFNFNWADARRQGCCFHIQRIQDQCLIIVSYEWHWANELKHCDQHISYNILNYKEQYLQMLKDKIQGLIDGSQEYWNHDDILYQQKIWYHIYTGFHILKNNAFELSNEEINNINILHDSWQDYSQTKEIIDTLIEEVSQWQI